jgi:integrase
MNVEEQLLTSTIWSYLSHVNSFFEYGLRIIVKSADPTIKRKLKLWQKQDLTKKAKTFSKDQVERFLNDAPNSFDYLVKKVCLIVAIHGLLRLNEIHDLHWSRFEKKEDMFLVTIFR